jgi:hypothetical protein
MRLQQPRASVFIAVAVVLTTVFGLVASGDSPTRPGGDGIFRIVRGGPQRLDFADAIGSEESPDPTVGHHSDAIPAAYAPLVVPGTSHSTRFSTGLAANSLASGQASSTSIDDVSQQTRPDTAIVPPPGGIAGPPGDSVERLQLPHPLPLLALSHHPTLGRAPPSA